MGVTRETRVSSPTDLSILISNSPGVPLRATPTRSALRVDADTQESVVELLVPASSVAKLAICRRIARRTPLRVHLVRLIRSQVHRVAFSPSLRIMLLRPQIRAEIHEEFRTSFGPSDSSGNLPPITIHTWLERFNKQKPRSFEKATAPTRLAVYKFEGNAVAWWKGYKQAKATDTAEEQAKNFQWGLRRQKSGDRHQPTSQQSSLRNHSHNNDHHGSDRRGTTAAATTTTLATTTGIPVMGVTRETWVSSPIDLPIL
nr:hypothetical protein [Tanacetum cinerariifolium]